LRENLRRSFPNFLLNIASKQASLIFAMADAMRANVAALLSGIDRYNPENLPTLERYVEMQAEENVYDLEANLSVLKLYQFNPAYFQATVTGQILLKALTNLPHNDFTLCKCLIDSPKLEEEILVRICELADLLEMCQFTDVWRIINQCPGITMNVEGFEDSVRKFICHVISITYQTIHKERLQELLGGLPELHARQWAARYGWKEQANGELDIANLEESVKTKKITEKITFDSVAVIMANAPSVTAR